MNIHVAVVYDGIEHSVFEGQVYLPLLHRLHNNASLEIHIISFEAQEPSPTTLQRLTSHPRLHLHLCKKTSFFLGFFSLWYAARQLKVYIDRFSCYTMQARGPLAAALALSVISERCTVFHWQVRGLLAEEFLYTKQGTTARLLFPLYYLRYLQLNHFEKSLFEYKHPDYKTITLEAVSPELKRYLHKTYRIAYPITIAHDDIPSVISPENLSMWRKKIRNQLGIESTKKVFIYNGSCKPWQCFEESIELFKNYHKKHQADFLLILTPDVELCRAYLASHLALPCWHVQHVAHHEIYHYLAAGNVGIMLRKPHLINWIARPTKALEYQAARLEIMHNNTVAYLLHESESHSGD